MEQNSPSSSSQKETSHTGHPFAFLVIACVVGLLLITAAATLMMSRVKPSSVTLPTPAAQQVVSLVPTVSAADAARLNNQKRRSDVKAILSLIWNYAIDNKGAFPPGITQHTKRISSDEVDLCTAIQSLTEKGAPIYIEQLPLDPLLSDTQQLVACSSNYITGYTVYEQNGAVTVSAPYAELGQTISETL